MNWCLCFYITQRKRSNAALA